MHYQLNDGGRSLAGYKGQTRDCVVRAISIATEKPYQEVYEAMKQFSHTSPRNGVYKRVYSAYNDERTR